MLARRRYLSVTEMASVLLVVMKSHNLVALGVTPRPTILYAHGEGCHRL